VEEVKGILVMKSICHYDNNGAEYWYEADNKRALVLHREDGPAILIDPKTCQCKDCVSWYFHGIKIDCQTQKEFEQLMRMKAFW
jgi:hypothetical protein